MPSFFYCRVCVSVCPWITLCVVAGVNAVAGEGDVLVLVFQRLQEGHQVLVVRQLLGHGEGHHHHVDGRLALRQGAEQRGDWTVELLHGALGGGRGVAVVLGITHAWYRKRDGHGNTREGNNKFTSKWWIRKCDCVGHEFHLY